MIIDLNKFIVGEKPYWDELGGLLDQLARDPQRRLELKTVRRFHYLYQRASADLAKIMTFSAEREVRLYLESLVERAYGEIHETRLKPHRLNPRHWFFKTFPRTFRRHLKAFWLALAITLLGTAFGGMAVTFDSEAKGVLMPWQHLQQSPSERVAQEEGAAGDQIKGQRSSFSAYLMTHNTQVSILAMALGMTWGVGTIILLFGNGVLLGAVAMDYLLAGEGVFLVGWLLPHGSVEIPSILLAGQAGLMLAGALIGWGRPTTLRARMRAVSVDVVTLIFGVGLLLIWAGLVESFLSQYHEPVLPYSIKIGFGLVELILLIWFLWKSGTGPDQGQVDGFSLKRGPQTGWSILRGGKNAGKSQIT